MMSDETNNLLMGGGVKSAAFKNHGDAVQGEITGWATHQRTDFKTREPLWWDEEKTRPQQQIAITLSTPDQDDEDDDGVRRVYVKVPSQMMSAIRDAVAKAKADGLEVGGILMVKYVGDAKPTARGLSGQKLYEAGYRRPTLRIPAEDADRPF